MSQQLHKMYDKWFEIFDDDERSFAEIRATTDADTLRVLSWMTASFGTLYAGLRAMDWFDAVSNSVAAANEHAHDPLFLVMFIVTLFSTTASVIVLLGMPFYLAAAKLGYAVKFWEIKRREIAELRAAGQLNEAPWNDHKYIVADEYLREITERRNANRTVITD